VRYKFLYAFLSTSLVVLEKKCEINIWLLLNVDENSYTVSVEPILVFDDLE